MKTELILASLLAGNVIASAAQFVAHEWGTFTSVHSADGTQLEWNPRTATDLPKFVYDKNRSNPQDAPELGKSSYLSLVRMETPVIYFYSDKELAVDVDVQFPQGTVTEWYPQTIPSAKRHTRWEKVTILPQVKDAAVLPNDHSSTHYYAARETDAAILRVPTKDKKIEHEKFLFYRGVGSCRVPLLVRLSSDEESLQLQNPDPHDISRLFVLRVRGNLGNVLDVRDLRSGQIRDIKVPGGDKPLSDLQGELAEAMRQALVAEGLYPREADAMVETWRDSWFTEQGLRILYILPRKWTDTILPLSIQPAPEQMVRVMVGRAEVITPTVEWQLMKQIVKFSEGDQGAISQVNQLGMGRFADAAVRRMLGRTPNQEFSRTAWNLLDASLRATSGPPKLAAK
jgi:hypothetical protein